MAPELKDQQQEILNNIISDEEDEAQLGESNEPEFDESDDADQDIDQEKEPDDLDEDVDDRSQHEQKTKPATDPVAQQPDEKLKLGFKADRAGNLIDKDGKIVFTAGRSRAVFEKVKAALYAEEKKTTDLVGTLNNVVTAGRELMQRYKTLKEQRNLPQSLGLNEVETKEALEMRALMKADAKSAVKKLLTMVHLNGIDLSDIGVNSALDPQEVAKHVLELQEAKRQQNEPDPYRQAQNEAAQFLQRHPDARPHTGLVAQAKQRFPHMTLDEIWFQIKLAAQRTGGNGQQRPQQQQPGRTVPRNSVPSVPTGRTKKLSIKAVDPTQSYSQIGRQLLADLKSLEER